MKESLSSDYRERIYRYYVDGGHKFSTPQSVASFVPRMPYLRRLIANHFPADRTATCLDLGCGHGALVYAARLLGYTNIVGVDRSPEQVRTARRLGIPGIHEGDLLNTLRGLANASQDVVVAFDVVEHFQKNELVGFVDEVHRVLKPGGKWLLHTPNGESPFVGIVRYGDMTHELAFTRASMSQLLLASEFSQVDCFEDTPVPHGAKSVIRAALWPIVRSGLLAMLAVETGRLDRTAILSQNFLTVAVK
jgi:2-polyprenyl-3-methyl-5-hydroxy-6-metoxy-1,4-benzoquinol methylase